VARAHLVRGLSRFFPQKNGNQIEENELNGFIQASHRQQTGRGCVVVRHGLRREMDHHIRTPRSESNGLSRDDHGASFGRAGDTVFIASELYSSPTQRLIGRPSARISNPREAVIQYRSEDIELEYKYECHFRLLESGKMSFRNRVVVAGKRSRKLVGTVKQEGMLIRLLTSDEQRAFARPSRHEVPKSEILTRKNFSAFGSEREGHTAVVTADQGE